MSGSYHQCLAIFSPPKFRRGCREWHCARRQQRLAPLPGRPTPHSPCWPVFFNFATVAASDPGRVSNFHTTSDSGRHIARRSDNAMSLRCLFLPFATTCHRVARNALSTASLLLCMPLADSPFSSPFTTLASLCQCVKSRPKPAAPPCPRPGRRCRRQSGSSFPLPHHHGTT